MGANYPSIV